MPWPFSFFLGSKLTIQELRWSFQSFWVLYTHAMLPVFNDDSLSEDDLLKQWCDIAMHVHILKVIFLLMLMHLHLLIYLFYFYLNKVLASEGRSWCCIAARTVRCGQNPLAL